MKKIKIAIDGMGGDFAPGEIVKGTVAGAREHCVDIALVGPSDVMQNELAKHDLSGLNIELVHTDQYLVEGEHPAFALREKRNASILLATKLVKEGKADAVLGAGPTGGVVSSALYVLGTLEGISRPVAGGVPCGYAPDTIMMDCGGNIDCEPFQLLDFAIVGAIYCRKMLNIPNPTVALLSVGAEKGKGNAVIQDSYEIFEQSGLNFIGNVEGYDIPLGKANVIICDGFIGNIVVKFCENLGKTIAGWLCDRLVGKLDSAEVRNIVHELTLATNPTDARGGGPLLAVNGVACVAHGRCNGEQFARAILEAKLAVDMDLVGAMKTELAAIRNKVKVPDFRSEHK
jgi:phosphate acyltransferase